MIYEELVHITALAHLSNSVKRELASVIIFEAHITAGTVRKCRTETSERSHKRLCDPYFWLQCSSKEKKASPGTSSSAAPWTW